MYSNNILFNMLLQFAKQFWWLILLIVGLKVLEIFIPIIKGKVGEGMVNLAAKIRLDPKMTPP